jgi:hypothetical protein
MHMLSEAAFLEREKSARFQAASSLQTTLMGADWIRHVRKQTICSKQEILYSKAAEFAVPILCNACQI